MRTIHLRTIVVGCMLISGATVHSGYASEDARLAELATLMVANPPTAVCETYSCSEWTQKVLASLSASERKAAATRLRSRVQSELLEGRIEQFRIQFRDAKLADSQLIVSYPLSQEIARGDHPVLAFSSAV